MAAGIGTAFDVWHPVVFKPVEPAANKMIAVAEITKNGGQHELHDHHLHVWEAKVPNGMACRYLRLAPAPDRTAEVEVWRKGEHWKSRPRPAPPRCSLPTTRPRPNSPGRRKVSLPSHPAPNSHLCVALNGEHGKNGAYAALRMDGSVDRCPAAGGILPGGRLRVPPRIRSSNFTYFFPITPRMHGRSIEVVVLGLAGCDPALKPEVWTTTYPHPYESLEMVLE